MSNSLACLLLACCLQSTATIADPFIGREDEPPPVDVCAAGPGEQTPLPHRRARPSSCRARLFTQVRVRIQFNSTFTSDHRPRASTRSHGLNSSRPRRRGRAERSRKEWLRRSRGGLRRSRAVVEVVRERTTRPIALRVLRRFVPTQDILIALSYRFREVEALLLMRSLRRILCQPVGPLTVTGRGRQLPKLPPHFAHRMFHQR